MRVDMGTCACLRKVLRRSDVTIPKGATHGGAREPSSLVYMKSPILDPPASCDLALRRPSDSPVDPRERRTAVGVWVVADGSVGSHDVAIARYRMG